MSGGEKPGPDGNRATARGSRMDGGGGGGDLLARDARRVWHPYTQHGAEAAPLPVVAARGALLVLEDGRELVDGISSWSRARGWAR